MNIRIASKRYKIFRFPRLFSKTAVNGSTTLYVSRNGICLEQLIKISHQGKFLFIGVNYARLIFWLKKGLFIHPQMIFPFDRLSSNDFYNLQAITYKNNVSKI